MAEPEEDEPKVYADPELERAYPQAGLAVTLAERFRAEFWDVCRKIAEQPDGLERIRTALTKSAEEQIAEEPSWKFVVEQQQTDDFTKYLRAKLGLL